MKIALEQQLLEQEWGHVMESCSVVTRADWPTRRNDDTCPRQALAICMNCEDLLCVVHTETCPICRGEFCSECIPLHEEDHKLADRTDA